MPVGDIFRVKIGCYQGDQVAINTLHYVSSAETGAGATQDQIAAAIDVVIASKMKAVLTSLSTYNGVQVQRIFPGLNPKVASTTAGKGVGTATPPPLPLQVCGVVTWRTNFAGRKHRGRMYVPWPAQSNSGPDSLPIQGYKTLVVNLADALLLPVVAGDGVGNSTTLNLVIWHRKDLNYDAVITFLVRTKWGTQRRRGSYGRPNLVPPW